ncbi:MAG: EamA family transporter [Leptospirales bacterium]
MFLVALLLEDIGFILLARGMREASSPLLNEGKSRIWRILTNPRVGGGVFLQAIYYVLLLALIQRVPVSLVVPMTGFGYVLTAFLARIFLKEPVSLRRWAGILLITIGVVLISSAGD